MVIDFEFKFNKISIYTGITFGFIYACKNIIERYKITKDKGIITNIISIYINGAAGFLYGYGFGIIIGSFWPIAFPLLCIRAIEKKTIDFNVLFGDE